MFLLKVFPPKFYSNIQAKINPFPNMGEYTRYSVLCRFESQTSNILVLADLSKIEGKKMKKNLCMLF